MTKLRYIKTDVEGHDVDVLRSIEGLIRDFRPYVKSEVGKLATQGDRAEIYRIFSTYNYTIRVPENNHRLHGPVLTQEDMQTRKAFDIFAVPNQS